jgi:hypothetical protein
MIQGEGQQVDMERGARAPERQSASQSSPTASSPPLPPWSVAPSLSCSISVFVFVLILFIFIQKVSIKTLKGEIFQIDAEPTDQVGFNSQSVFILSFLKPTINDIITYRLVL